MKRISKKIWNYSNNDITWEGEENIENMIWVSTSSRSFNKTKSMIRLINDTEHGFKLVKRYNNKVFGVKIEKYLI